MEAFDLLQVLFHDQPHTGAPPAHENSGAKQLLVLKTRAGCSKSQSIDIKFSPNAKYVKWNEVDTVVHHFPLTSLAPVFCALKLYLHLSQLLHAGVLCAEGIICETSWLDIDFWPVYIC